jgi:hypothetical protein
MPAGNRRQIWSVAAAGPVSSGMGLEGLDAPDERAPVAKTKLNAGGSREYRFMLHRMAIMVAAIAVASAAHAWVAPRSAPLDRAFQQS